MAAPTLSLTFTDGRSEKVTLNPRVLVEIERKFGGSITTMEGMLYGAWFRLGRPGEFDGWLDSLADIDADQGDATVPSQPEVSGGS